ncbi:MAG: hypothetical protein OXB92_01725 [Acidimicrobiaceae bacterium]|nr:hypothetical protein [Acidimicrobiaceae bacterium]
MDRFKSETKREAADPARRRRAAVPLDLDEARLRRGSGWDGDLDEMRTDRVQRL